MLKRRLPFLNRVMSSLVFLVAIAGLNGCGGGGGGSSSTPTPTPVIDAGVGYFDNGTADVYSDNANTTAVHITDLVGFVKGSHLMLESASQNLAWFGDLKTLNGTAYTADVRVYKDNAPVGTATLSGTLTSGSALSGTLTGQAYGDGTFSLVYSTDNTQQADVATIVRPGSTFWGNYQAPSQLALFIDSSGTITNNLGGAGVGNFGGCSVNGSVSAIANSALYKIQITLTKCGGPVVSAADGTYTGYATTTTMSTTNDTMIVALENNTHQYSAYGNFQ